MTRELKFRAWDKITRRWVDIEHLYRNSEGCIQTVVDNNENHHDLFKGNVILMQFTGLKDKNGKEIYEGDIIDNEGARQKYEVIFHNGCFCISQGGLGYHIFNEKKVEIIGNIYSNPELLTN